MMRTWTPTGSIIAVALCLYNIPAIAQPLQLTPPQFIIQHLNRNEAEASLDKAYELFQQGTAESLQAAIPYLEKAATLYKQIGNQTRQATALARLGRIHDLLGEKQKALDYYNQALPLFQAVGNQSWEATTLNNIGAVYSALGEKQKALDYLNQALPLRRAVGDRGGEAMTLNNIGRVYNDLGEKQKALDYYDQALPLTRAVGNHTLEATTLNNIGLVYSALGEKQKALNYLNQALPLRRAVGDRSGEASTLSSIGVVYHALGELQKALDYYDQALPLTRAVGDRGGEARTLSNIGAVYNALGEKQKALDYYDQALPLTRAVGDRGGEAVTLNNIGRVYDDLGEKQKALNYYDQALPLRRAVGDRGGEARTLSNIGLVYSALGEKQKALDYYDQALPLLQAVGDRSGEATTLSNIGAVYNALGEKQKALDYYDQALPLRRAVGDRSGEATTLNNIGTVYSDLGEKQKALDYLNQALPLSQAAGDRTQEAQTLGNIAITKARSGNLTEALIDIQAAIEIVEDLRSKIGSQDLRASYFATVQGYYKFYIELLMQLHQQNPNEGYDALALHISERSRARSLAELLTEANANIRQGVDPQLLEKEQNLIQQLNAVEQARHELVSGQYNDEQLEELKQKSKSLLTQLDQLEAKIRLNSPRYADLKYPEPLTASEIQQQVLDEETLLLTYSLGEDRSYLWAVTKDSINSYELPSQDEIEKAAETFRKSVTVDSGASLEAGVALSEIVLSPVLDQLENKRLLIVGDGVLQYVPFAALPVTSPPAPLLQGEGSQTNNSSPLSGGTEGGQTNNSSPLSGGSEGGYIPLLVTNEIVTLSSASTVAIQRQQLQNRSPVAKKLAVLADPVFSENDDRFTGIASNTDDSLSRSAMTRAARNLGLGEGGQLFDRLKYTRTEAEKILALVPENQQMKAFDFNANWNMANNPNLANYQIVHLATHGLLDPVNPELSGVVLSLLDENGETQNGFLRLNDIFNLNLPAELVVLSACETGLGENIRGEGLVGLTRGFMYAGARRVVVSLWAVNDLATSEVMAKFYQKMLNEEQNPVVALREAQLEMWNSENRQSPYYWAAFTIQGDWQD
jgi:CHAT domain-containing protein/tetratricopeptide (TPR) repeat protein